MLDDTKFLARDIMTRDVAVIYPESTLLAAVKLMASHRISGLPVVDEQGTLVGMMSEGDVLGRTRGSASARYGGLTCWPKAPSSHLTSCERSKNSTARSSHLCRRIQSL